jgi:predicted heme/steroid binding protein
MERLFKMHNNPFILIITVLLCILVLAGCGSGGPSSSSASDTASSASAAASDSGEKVFTLEELAKYDGKNGNPAYVAVNGVVYDVTDRPLWKNGTHNGHLAGTDQTELIKLSPHGQSKLKDLPVVGKLQS